MEKKKKVNEIVNNYTEKEILEALLIKVGSIERLNDLIDEYSMEDYKKVDEKTYHTPTGIIKKLDTFENKKALVGDYMASSFYITEMVLDSLGIEMVNAKSSNEVFERIKNGEKYDVIFTNNVYGDGTGPELLKKLKALNGFNTPVIIHTISDEPKEKFLELGFSGYLQKPIKQEEVIDLLNKLLK